MARTARRGVGGVDRAAAGQGPHSDDPVREGARQRLSHVVKPRNVCDRGQRVDNEFVPT